MKIHFLHQKNHFFPTKIIPKKTSIFSTKIIPKNQFFPTKFIPNNARFSAHAHAHPHLRQQIGWHLVGHKQVDQVLRQLQLLRQAVLAQLQQALQLPTGVKKSANRRATTCRLSVVRPLAVCAARSRVQRCAFRRATRTQQRASGRAAHLGLHFDGGKRNQRAFQLHRAVLLRKTLLFVRQAGDAVERWAAVQSVNERGCLEYNQTGVV